ncbi:HAD family phosphatase [Ruminococcus sp.]|uniref:HAD family hydrolase n=1 Tax=Ruminococcus sp. TaxID=41978 RepID=UPI0025E17F16|nr:HAD family phosphatase [Ruminococcus sp.]MBQ8967570.1 HAD family phosphatase [Ruminococcus sp.]
MYTLENLDGIVFDMDGVIFDTERLSMRCWKKVGERHGLENVEENIRLCIGRSTKDTKRIIAEAYGDKVDLDELYAESRVVIREAFEQEGIPVKIGAPEVLRWLHDSGIKVGLASSTSYDTVVREMQEVGLIDCFDVIIGGDMVENSKPDPDIYLKACQRLGVDPANTLAVEDSRNGMISAHAAGMIPVLIPDLVEPDEEMLEKAHIKLNSLTEFKDTLLSTGI